MRKKTITINQNVTKKEFKDGIDRLDKRIDGIEQKMATKDDVSRLDKKIDTSIEKLDKKIDTAVITLTNEIVKNSESINFLAKEVIKNTEDIKTIKETMATKDDIKQIITAIDSFAGKTLEFERRVGMSIYRLDEIQPKVKEIEPKIKDIEPKVEDREKRISTLESHLPASN